MDSEGLPPRWGGLGPVEDGPGGPQAGEVLAAGQEPAAARAPGRSPRVLAAVLLLAAAASADALAPTPGRPPAPPPWPSQSTAFSYLGPGRAPDRDTRSFSVRITAATAAAAPPVTLEAVTQRYAGLTVDTRPAPPITLRPGERVRIEVVIVVRDCRAAPAGAQLPFLDVTLRNTRAIQTQSQILGDRYAHDLSSAILALCDSSGHRTWATNSALRTSASV